MQKTCGSVTMHSHKLIKTWAEQVARPPWKVRLWRAIRPSSLIDWELAAFGTLEHQIQEMMAVSIANDISRRVSDELVYGGAATQRHFEALR